MNVLVRVLYAAWIAGIGACDFPRPADVETKVDAPPLDASIDIAADAQLCFGSYVNICLEAVS
jgi:hypothetical protein